MMAAGLGLREISGSTALQLPPQSQLFVTYYVTKRSERKFERCGTVVGDFALLFRRLERVSVFPIKHGPAGGGDFFAQGVRSREIF